MSELLSFALFLASVLIYAWKAGRNTWWFAATLTVLGLFVVLNITLFASDYFTGAGINDAVLYTLTNSLTGAGVSKYILPGIGIVLGLTAVFGALGWILRRRRHFDRTDKDEHIEHKLPDIAPYHCNRRSIRIDHRRRRSKVISNSHTPPQAEYQHIRATGFMLTSAGCKRYNC